MASSRHVAPACGHSAARWRNEAARLVNDATRLTDTTTPSPHSEMGLTNIVGQWINFTAGFAINAAELTHFAAELTHFATKLTHIATI